MTRVSRGGWRLARLPALLLVAVALHQLWLAHSQDLDAWHGGGFGMFSTTDVFARRHLHAALILDGARRELELPQALELELRRALALPSDARLRALADALLAGNPEDAPHATAVSLAVYAADFDPRTLAPSGRLLRSLRVPLPAGAPP